MWSVVLVCCKDVLVYLLSQLARGALTPS
ncbi:TPA: hypothetical protein N0F65_007463 [Lagenidium giganteum]|uniref:Uncharacterized protein n=1 Tax=Lagenidium giganteum TaxID=4803 RepID=A0AAV2ZH94_9STRA|nr:TPA: hypothetical protein N0F65_007463 [Lagenidium giganteum]